MPTTQRAHYGRYPESFSAVELARYFRLGDGDCEWITTKRRESGRQDYALQLTTSRSPGVSLKHPTVVLNTILQTLSSQIDIANPDDCVVAYRARKRGIKKYPALDEFAAQDL